jgi:tRNA dimethylallyltransferase
VVAGATATGKTGLAIRLAKDIPGAEIISADSRQIYRGMDIATAKPSAEDRATVPHHGLDLVDPDEPFSAADYQRYARAALSDIATRGGVALLVGGTGLYLRAVARGLPLDQGDADPAVRAEVEERFGTEGLEPLVAELLELDAAGAQQLDLRNPRRVVRALERARLTGSALPPPPQGYGAPVTWLGLRRDDADHRRAIEARIDEHFESGLLEEAQKLRQRYPEDLTAFSAMGYREAFDVLAERSQLDEAKAADTRRTWAYAKRQRTWFRAEPEVAWLEAGADEANAAQAALVPFLRDLDRDVYAGRR